MSICAALVVLDLPGVSESGGVKAEQGIAVEFGLPVYLADPANPAETLRVLKGIS